MHVNVLCFYWFSILHSNGNERKHCPIDREKNLDCGSSITLISKVDYDAVYSVAISMWSLRTHPINLKMLSSKYVTNTFVIRRLPQQGHIIFVHIHKYLTIQTSMQAFYLQLQHHALRC